jgi:chemotaxis protein MotD
MTTIGNLLANLPIVRDPKGSLDQSGSLDDSTTSSGRKGGTFATFLSDLSQSTKSVGIGAFAVNAGDTVPENPKTPAAGGSQTSHPQEALEKADNPADFTTSLLGRLGGGAKSTIQPNMASPQVGKQSQTVVNPDLSSLKAAAGEVTGLLGRITKDANEAPDVRQSNQGKTEHSDEPAGAGGKDVSTKNDPASTSPQENAKSINVASINVAMPPLAISPTEPKSRTGTPPTAVSSAKGDGTRRARNDTEDDEKQPDSVSTETTAGQPTSSVAPLVVTPVAGKPQGGSPSNGGATSVSHFDRSAGKDPLSFLDDADLSLANGLDKAAMAGAPASPAATGSFEMKVTALSAVTHFAPAARLSPVQQISDALTSSMPSLVAAQKGQPAAATASAGAPLFQAAANDLVQATQVSAPSIKTLNLQLQPENLGQVTVKLNLSDNGLTVQLDAVHRQTAELINQDKQAFAQKLVQSGYTVSSVEVTSTPQHSSQFSSQSSPHQGQADAGGGQSGGEASGSGGSPNGERQNNDSAAFAEKSSQDARNVPTDEGTAARLHTGGGRELFV